MSGLRLTGVGLVLGGGDTAVTAIDGVDLAVAPGETVAVVGPSGSGKSSLLAVSGALREPTSGTVEINGLTTTPLSDRALTTLRRDHVGYVFQQANLFAALTVREQLLIPRHVSGRITAADRARAAELLAAVGLEHRAGHRPHQLSGGERQRAALARALMAGPAVLLVDEPTSALDRAGSARIAELIAARTREAECATLIVTHDHDILEYADRVRELRDGRLT
ncbi:ABC transporter ATP-binding protein [Catenulispora yoronensis]|uniref:ABC transporter ATP-binding protein n=1 Tax=Catenulispora yoronensis TaxID=450799 RepID=A0ABP5GYJ4_9ACTN